MSELRVNSINDLEGNPLDYSAGRAKAPYGIDKSIEEWVGSIYITHPKTSDMISDVDLVEGITVECSGDLSAGGEGGGRYLIVQRVPGRSYGFAYEQLDNGLDAKIVSGRIGSSQTVKIPSDFGTLQEAVDSLSFVVSNKGAVIDLLIESGHSPSSGISVSNGSYSRFQVSSEDAEVLIATGFGKSTPFITGDNAEMPILNCLVDGNAGELGFGYYAQNNAVGYVNPGCGVKNAWQDGCAARRASRIFADDTVFSGNAVNAGTSSNIHAISSQISADRAIATGSNYYGVQSTSGGVISFRFGNASGASRYGIRVRDQGRVDAESANCDGCGSDGVRAFIAGYVNFRLGTANNCGNYGISCTRGSIVAANEATLNDSGGWGAYISQGASCDLGEATILRSVEAGVECANSTASVAGANISDGASIGLLARGASNVVATSATINDNATSGISCQASRVDAGGATINGQVIGVTCYDGGFVNVTDANCEGNSQRGIYAYNGGHISAINTLCRKVDGVDSGGTNNSDITCLKGGYIAASGAQGGVSKVVNSVTADGTILR
jgi:hypothetical protein